MEENIQPSQSVQKPAGSLAWHVVTMLVTIMVISGAIYLPFLMLSIGLFGGGLSVNTAGILDIVFNTIGVLVAVGLGAAYLLTKYEISSELSKKITLWVTGITVVSVALDVVSARTPLQIIAPLVNIGVVYVALSMAFDQYRAFLQSFRNVRIRIIEGLILIVGILSFIVGIAMFSFNGTLVDFVNNSPLVSEQDRIELNEAYLDLNESRREYAEVQGKILTSDLDYYYIVNGGAEFPSSLEDQAFLDKRISNILGQGKDIDVTDYIYTVSEDKQSYKLCLVGDANTCWEGVAPDLE